MRMLENDPYYVGKKQHAKKTTTQDKEHDLDIYLDMFQGLDSKQDIKQMPEFQDKKYSIDRSLN